MRTFVGSLCLLCTLAMAAAQDAPKQSGDSPHSTGRTVSPETDGKQQPQGNTGPLNTTEGGAPAASPQGQTPSGMQAAPDGSSKTVVDPKASGEQAGSNQTAKDTVPPATDKSESTRAGTQEPSAKAGEAAQSDKGAFDKGTLTAPGALTDVDTAPAKFSARTAADDALPIAAYALKHLSDEQRRAISEAVGNEGRQSAAPDADFARVGAQVPTAIALSGLHPLPERVSNSIPEMSDVMFTRAADKIVLINPRTRVVIGVLER
jgi:hypothetical protein